MMVFATTSRERRLGYFAWVAVCLIWGTTYLAIRITLETIPPWLMSGMRWITAGSMLSAYLAIRREPMPRLSWRGILFLAVSLLVLGNGGVVWAEQYVPSGLAAVLVAAQPFWMASVEAFKEDGESLTRRGFLGLAVGFGGILLLVWPELVAGGAAGRGFAAGVIALQIACFGWSIGSSYSRRHARDQNVLVTTAAQMLAGGILMLAIGSGLGEWRALHFSPRTAGALAYLATVGAIGGFVAYSYALRHLPVAVVSLYAYINPVIAVALGVALLGEPFDSRSAVAVAVVFVGVAIVKAPKRAPEKVPDGALERAAGAHRAR